MGLTRSNIHTGLDLEAFFFGLNVCSLNSLVPKKKTAVQKKKGRVSKEKRWAATATPDSPLASMSMLPLASTGTSALSL